MNGKPGKFAYMMIIELLNKLPNNSFLPHS